MNKAIFVGGLGTAYSFPGGLSKNLEVNPVTLPALRFLRRRGYLLVLLATEYQEYLQLQLALKDKTLALSYWNGQEAELASLVKEKQLDLAQSFFITDRYRPELFGRDCAVILVLTGQGLQTLQNLEKQTGSQIRDVCKDIYAAAIRIALGGSGLQ